MHKITQRSHDSMSIYYSVGIYNYCWN